MGALSKLEEFLLKPQIRTFSGNVPGTFRYANVENEEPSGDRSQNDAPPEVEFIACRASNVTDSDPDETYHSVTGAQEELPYSSPGTSSEEQKKVRRKSQPQFRSENTPATIEADQILLILQQLANNSNSIKFNINFNRISKSSKSLTTTIPFLMGSQKVLKYLKICSKRV